MNLSVQRYIFIYEAAPWLTTYGSGGMFDFVGGAGAIADTAEEAQALIREHNAMFNAAELPTFLPHLAELPDATLRELQENRVACFTLVGKYRLDSDIMGNLPDKKVVLDSWSW
jgi:hypothetical protein